MSPQSFFARLVEAIPRVRTRLQLVGFVVAVVGYLVTRATVPEATASQIAVGSVGIGLVVFAQMFGALKEFPESSRVQLVIVSFLAYLVFAVAMFWIATRGILGARHDRAVLTLRDRGHDVSEASYHAAIKTAVPDTVQLYVDAGLSPNLLTPEHDAPLVEAARLPTSDIVKLLVSRGAFVNIDHNATTPLLAAVVADRIDTTRALIKLGANVNQASAAEPCATPLRSAVRNPLIVEELLTAGASTAQPPNCPAIIYAAAEGGNADSVKLLIRHKASVDPDLSRGYSPLFKVIGNQYFNPNLAVLDALLAAGANPNVVTSDGHTLLLRALAAKSVPALKLLLKYHADPNLDDGDGLTPLIDAVRRNGGLPFVNELLAGGADPNRGSVKWRTPLYWALLRNDPDNQCAMALALLHAGAKPDLRDSEGITVVEAAAKEVTLDTVCAEAKKLLKPGA